MKKTVFIIFAIIQSCSLVVVIFLIFRGLNLCYPGVENVIGTDTHIMVSIMFPLFLFFVEYMIYSEVVKR